MHKRAVFTEYKRNEMYWKDEVHPFHLPGKGMHLIPFASLLFPIILAKAYVMIVSIFCLNIPLNVFQKVFLLCLRDGKETTMSEMNKRA